jgi:hypothetical protein
MESDHKTIIRRTGFIAYLGIMLSRFTGENFLDKNKPQNVFDSLFFHCVATALLVYANRHPGTALACTQEQHRYSRYGMNPGGKE